MIIMVLWVVFLTVIFIYLQVLINRMITSVKISTIVSKAKFLREYCIFKLGNTLPYLNKSFKTVYLQKASCATVAIDYWDYTKEYGPENWQNIWKLEKRQSPIDILTQLAKYDSTLGEYNIDTTPIHYKSHNIGLNVSTAPSEEQKQIFLSGGALKDNYRLREFHFHWGEKNTCGCEHTLNGQRFAAELHLVHWNTDLYSTEKDALSGPDGLAVLGVFLEAHELHEPNSHLNVILNLFHKVPYKGQIQISENAFTPYSLLPENKSEYFTYPGSLTTPPLTENVTWTVFKHPLKISLCQIEKFNQLFAVSENGKDEKHQDFFQRKQSGRFSQPPTITNNYRPVQPLNERTVYASFKV